MKLEYEGPVVLAIMDGVGLRRELVGNAVKLAHTEFLNLAVKNYPSTGLLASGEAVGVLKGDMGNSEVGHNAIGSGQIIKQGIARVEEAFETGAVWKTQAWQDVMARIRENPDSTLHFSGIFSDGKVHSSIDHLKRMISRAHQEGVRHIRIHAVLDGRDVPPQSAEKYINEVEYFISSLERAENATLDYKIASGGGRMVYVADRYESDWDIVKNGWDAIVWGQAERKFLSASEAIDTFRTEDPGLQDQYIPPFVITDIENRPIGTVKDGDSFIYFDFRADRAIEIAEAFTYEEFPYFDRGTENNRRLDVYFVGMTEYNSDTHVPEHRLVEPVEIKDTLNTFLGSRNISDLAVSETVKFGHITYYFNGNSYEEAPGEKHIEIPSDTQPFNTRPWMKSAEITDEVLKEAENFKFIRLNFPGGDMVGHFAELEPTITAMEAIDIQLGRIAKMVDDLGGVLIITADHGNAEELTDENGVPKTAHSTSPVPFIVYDNSKNRDKYELKRVENAGLSNIAATLALFLGQEDYPSVWREPLIKLL
ncbi:MAG: 2,3-bisphosphoglycerate-independent phosphoglycerate mutase [Candidatus Saccharibacteria bacterium]|nr:2,3-bisphosphoglycerate-independent phosphoglycerate mutase [Candidatus Saccharibacteria bacterium]